MNFELVGYADFELFNFELVGQQFKLTIAGEAENNSKFKIQKSKFKIYITMSQNSKIRKQRYAKEQERKGKKVVEYILWAFIILAVAFMIWTTMNV